MVKPDQFELIAAQLPNLGLEPEKIRELYQSGQASGLKAEVASMLRQDREPAEAVFRVGYIAGLKGFLDQHQIGNLGLYSTPDDLTNASVLSGYLKGRERQAPEVARDYHPWKESIKEFKIDYPRLDKFGSPFQQLREFEEIPLQRTGGYRLGFIAGITADYDVPTTPLALPIDNPSYYAFMQGLRAETRPLLTGAEAKGKIIFNEFFTPNYAAMDEMFYHSGLRIWLASQSIDTKYIFIIRDPKYLPAFKAGLQGTPWPPSVQASHFDVLKSFSQIAEKGSSIIQDFLSEIGAGTLVYRLGQDLRQNKTQS